MKKPLRCIDSSFRFQGAVYEGKAGLDSPGDGGVTAATLLGALALAAVAVLVQRGRRRTQRPAGWVPWNGVLFVAIVVAAVALAHMLGISRS